MGRLAKDSIITSIIIAIGFLFGTFTGIFIYPKLFAKADLGIFRYIVGWGTLFAQFCSFGVGSAAIRTYYKLKSKRAHGEMKVLLLLVPMCILLIFVLSFVPCSDFFLKKTLNGLPFEAWAIITSIILMTVGMTYVKTYQGVATILQKTPVLFFVNEIMLKIGVLVVFMLYYYQLIGSSIFLLGLSVVYLSQLVAVLYIIRSYFEQYSFTLPSATTAKPFMKLSLFCLVDNSVSLLVAQIDLMMVGALLANSLVQMQEYGMAIQVASVIFLPWRSFMTTSVPFIA
ncbi:MAG TPA: hypothetical protein VD905_06920, partial [Flavobacteriales bacterium]|nr:hypothetical protein [Flavobacteriales bacterium]